ncbi:MAG: endonuclease [Bacilli bacterium]|nr:endonuclease [Bacilli bacterium]
MKKIGIYSLPLLFAFSLGCVAFLGEKPTNKTEASSYVLNTVPTNIDLNDCSDDEIREYYSNLNSLSNNEKSGTNLLKNLKPILKNGQKYFSYGSGATTAVWQAYEIIDRDWEKSPATAITGYNAKSNIISNYQYGKNESNPGSNPYIHALYVNRDVDNNTQAWGNHNQDQWGINQEHIWQKSCGFDNKEKAVGARGDLMHLWAGNGKVNGAIHSNNYYGYVDKSKKYTDAGDYASTLSGNLVGSSKTFKNSTYNVFEPQDSDKGDIARAIFYMAARYNYYSGNDSDGIDAGNPNLEIINELNWNTGMSGYTSSTAKKGQIGILQDLLEWNRLDPPDEFEIHRNNLVFKNFTNNRNPFIDFPEWAEYIWGTCDSGNYSPSSTGYAQPLLDTINDFNIEPPVDRELDYITISGQTTELNTNDEFSFGGIVTAHYTNNTSSNVTYSSSFSGYDMSKPGKYTVVVTYNEKGITRTASYLLTVTTKTSGTFTWDLSIASYDPKYTTDSVIWRSSFATMEAKKTEKGRTPVDNYLGGKDENKSTRFYTGNSLIFTPLEGYKIDKVEFTSTTEGFANAMKESTWTNAIAEGTNKTTIITPIDGSDVFSAVHNDTSGNISAKIYYSTYEKVTSISAMVNKDFKVGEFISTDDITVVDNFGNILPGFTFDSDGYQFLYGDALSGGARTNKTFENAVHYKDLSCSLSVYVSRNEYSQIDTYSDVLTCDTFDATRSEYVDFSDKNRDNNDTIESTANYCGSTAKGYGAIQITSNNNNRGIYTNVSGGKLESISVVWNTHTTLTRTINIFGSDTPYQKTNDLFVADKKGTLIGSIIYNNGEPTSISVTKSYKFIGIISNSNALYLDEITINYSNEETALNVANYVMFEDIDNQCETKYSIAKTQFNKMSDSQREEFMSSTDYVISTARERMTMWAKHHGESFNFNNLLTKNTQNISLVSDNKNSLLIAIFSLIIIGSLIGFTYYYKKECK